jgi:DnaJ family protein A protein 2
MFVKLTVKFPESIDPSVIPLLEKALPPRKPVEKFPKNIHVEEVEFSAVDHRRQPDLRDDAMDEDEDGGEPRVQCANQ